MSRKPTYKHLEQRIRELEAETAKCKQAEQALKESENKFKSTFETTHDAITLPMDDGRFLDCNRRALDLFGLENKEAFLDKRP
jgi:PAS domain-containing protein